MWIEELDNKRGMVNCCNSQKKAVRMGYNYKVTGNAVIFTTFLTLFSGNEDAVQSREFCRPLFVKVMQSKIKNLLVCDVPVSKKEISIFPFGDYLVLSYTKMLEPTTGVITCLVAACLVAGIGCIAVYPYV